MEFYHKPIMLNECLEGLNIKQSGTYVDCTLGGGGHSREICSKLGKNGLLVGIDQDISAINAATECLSGFSEKTCLVKGNFFNIKNILSSLSLDSVDGFLIDLGVSSHQLDEPLRGFSYMNNGPLDMRMDISSDICAYDVVNKYSKEDLCRIIYDYGEERYAKRIANNILVERQKSEIKTTFQLVEIVKRSIPAESRFTGHHPAKRTFQAIRIEVNGELSGINPALSQMVSLLKSGGRLCVITFHSLEDRIVKNTFKDFISPCKCPPEIPFCVCNKKAVIKSISKKPIIPTAEEINENPRARSAKLRVVEKL